MLHIWQHCVQATLLAGLYPPVQTAVWKANRMHWQLCSAVTLHCVLLSQFNIQIQTIAVTPSLSQLGLISTGDQLAIRNTAPSSLFWSQYHSTTVLEQTAYCKRCGSLIQSSRKAAHLYWIHALNKETLKKQSETREAEEKLHSSFNKRTRFSQNYNSERGLLAELLPNSGKHVQLSSDSAQREDHGFLSA